MARLPTALELSGPENLRSGRPIAQIDTSGIGRGLASLGADLQQIGAERQQQENTVDIARAEAEKTKGLLEVQDQFRNDPDYATYSKRAPALTGEVVKKAAGLIRDPQMRERWSIGAGTDAFRVNNGINDHGVTMQRESETVAFDNALETNRRLYVDPNTPPDVRAKAKADIAGAIEQGQKSGLLDPSQAEARRKSYIEDAEFSRGKLAVDQDPSIIQKHVISAEVPREGAALLDTIAGTESGGRYDIINGGARFSSYADHPKAGQRGSVGIAAGRYQFLPSTWERASKALGLKDFSPANQDKAAWWLAQQDYQARTGRDLLADLKSPDANMQANIRRALAPTWEGLKSLGDGNFASKIAAGPHANPDWYNAISPEQRYVIDNEVDTRNNQIAAETRANIDVATTNGPAAMLSTGQYTGTMPTQQQFFDAYGPQEGASRYDSFVASMQTSEQAYSMRTMSAADIQQMVAAAKPTSSGDDAALQAKRYDTLASAQEATIKAREADPATYVRTAFPAVNEQWNNAQAQGNYQSAVAASVAAQQQIGVKNIQPLPKEIAGNAVNVFKDEAQPQANRIGAVSSIIMATNDPAQRQMLFNQMVAEGLPDITQGAFEALSRGDQGAAQRLFQAAMVDPSKLAGNIPNNVKTSDIDQAVQAQVMDQGQIGDIYYGLSSGTAENYTRAQRDSKLINNAVNIRLRNGETMDQAIAGVSKDLYGDVQVVNQGHMQILVPTSRDKGAAITELSSKLPEVEAALKSAIKLPGATGGPVAAAEQQYPVIKSLGVQSVTTPMPGDNRMLEFWPPGEPGDAQYPRPKELAIDKPGVQIINSDTKPSDVAADIISHYMVEKDPKLKVMYQQFADTFKTPEGQARLKQDYEWAKQNEGEKRSFEDWASITRIPDYFRGYLFKQWPEKAYSQMYSKGQLGLLDQMGSYLQAGAGEANSQNAVINAAMDNHIPNILANGFFRNSGDGYVFIDPYTDSAVADEGGNPIIFKITGNLPPAPAGPITDLGGGNAQQLNQMRRTMGQ